MDGLLEGMHTSLTLGPVVESNSKMLYAVCQVVTYYRNNRFFSCQPTDINLFIASQRLGQAPGQQCRSEVDKDGSASISKTDEGTPEKRLPAQR
jgi:hypothetical protein